MEFRNFSYFHIGPETFGACDAQDIEKCMDECKGKGMQMEKCELICGDEYVQCACNKSKAIPFLKWSNNY